MQRLRRKSQGEAEDASSPDSPEVSGPPSAAKARWACAFQRVRGARKSWVDTLHASMPPRT
eukprot:847545-Pyramimonas_sp.AAC.2